MNNRLYSLMAAGLLLSVSGAAISARADSAPAADPWSGFYLGAQAGYLQGTGSNTDTCLRVSGVGTVDCFGSDDGFDMGDNDMSGVTAGGYLGFNYRIDSIVMGLEGDFNWDNANGNGGSNSVFDSTPFGISSASLNWDTSIRARLGYVVDERALLYVTGGPSWINADVDNSLCPTGVPGQKCGDENTEFGWQLGGGAEFMMTDHLSLKAEYIHGWYGNADMNLWAVTGAQYVLKQDLQTNVVRAGVAYHFGGL